MKKLLILSLIAFFALSSAKVFAQGTGIAPEIGSTHDYYVNASDASTQTSGSGDTYTWWITTDATNLLNENTASSGDYTVAGGATYNTGAVDAFTISLTWNPSSAGKTYYLVVQEEDATNSCKNLKAIEIQPTNNFTLQYAALDASSNLSDNAAQCAPDMGASASGATITYNYGTGDYEFKLIPTGISAAWQFDYDFSTVTVGAASATMTYSFDGTASGSSSDITTTPSGTINVPAGTGYVIVKVHVDNGTAEDGTTAQSLVLDLSNITDGTNSPTHIYKADGSTEYTGTVQSSQTVHARPGTSTIGYN